MYSLSSFLSSACDSQVQANDVQADFTPSVICEYRNVIISGTQGVAPDAPVANANTHLHNNCTVSMFVE